MRTILFTSARLALASCIVLSASPALAQFTQQGQKLVGSGAVGAATQGQAVALSADGSTAIVGGPSDNNSVGAVWVWTETAGVWSQQGTKLVGTGGVGLLGYGRSVALSADGNTAIVGGNDNFGVGAAWIWSRSGGAWTQQGLKLVGSGAVGNAGQGFSVSLSDDGNTALVSGTFDNSSAGAVWVWTRAGGVWTQQGPKLVGSGAVGPAVRQGTSVALSGDGNTAIVGGFADNNTTTGAAWVWTRSNGTWTQQGSKLVGSGGVGGTVNQIQQGISVDLSADGNTAVVGGNGDDDLAGAIWIWVRSGGSWSQQGSKLVVVDAVGKASHGRAVSMTDDGNMVIAGGRADDSSAGAAWIWIRSGGTWSQYGSKLVGSSAVGKAEQGFAVSLSGDGSTTISSGRLDDGSVGAVWIFVRSPPGAFGKISPANGAAGQSSGPTLSWGTSTAAEHYEYCYDLTNDNACSEWTRTSTITSVVVSVTDNTTLYWHVRAVNGGGTTYADGNAGAFWGFATQVVQGNTSSVISPSNGATGEPTRRRPPQMSLDADISGDAFHNASSGLWFKFLDFDGDGADELFLYSAATGAWFQMISDGVGGFIVVGNQTWTTGWQLYPTDLDSDRRTGLLLVHPASGVWYQARNLLRGSFDYSSGFWAPGLTIITRAPSR